MTGFSALPISDDPEGAGASDDGTGAGGDDAQFKGVARILGPRWAQLPALTIGLIGVQVMWSVEMSYASPYLISLGLSKSLMAIVFLAGPISGLVVQPLIGVLADNSTSRFGRRRPYILSGVVLCTLAILLLGFTRPTASTVTSLGSSANDALTIALAIFAIYCIDFGINAVQAVDRALLVDTLPPSTQASGNAWAARMLGIGSVAGFFIGNIDLPSIMRSEGSELEILSVVSGLLMVGTHLWTTSMVKERIFLGAKSQDKKTFKQEMRDLWDNARTLPYVIRQICIIQFFAWLAWFPILFYTTLYIGDLYRRSLAPSSDSDLITRAPHEPTAVDAEATRLGARAQLYSALVALATNFLAPLIVAETRGNGNRNGRGHASWQDEDEGRGWEEVDERWWRRWWRRIGRVHLATLWAASHAIFAACMFGTLFTDSVGGATVLMTITGLAWGITQWAPFSLLAEAILTTPEPDDGDVDDAQSILLEDTRTPQREEEQYLVGPDEDEDEVDIEDERYNLKRRSGSVSLERDEGGDGTLGNGGDIGAGAWDDVYPPGGGDDGEVGHDTVRGTARGAIMGNTDAQRSWVDITAGEDGGPAAGGSANRRKRRGKKGLAAKAGIIIGIHNVFVVVPQFLVTGISSVVFALFEPNKSVLHGHHPGKMPPPATNGTDMIGNSTLLGNSTLSSAIANATVALLRRQEDDASGDDLDIPEGPNAVAIIFRLGGVSAAVAFVICWRLAREMRKRY